MKKSIYLIVFIIIVVAIFLVLRPSEIQAPLIEVTLDPLNATYQIGEQSVALINGHAEVEIVPDSASKMIVDIFGAPTLGDLNGDGVDDAGIILVESSGGTGTFYYVAAVVDNAGTNAVLLGDRIAPQTLEIRDNMLVANYATREPGEPMSVMPSIGASKYLVFQNGVLLDQDLSNTNELLFGTWQNDENTEFTRYFKADGSLIDTDNSSSASKDTGTYSLITDSENNQILTITFPETELHFSVITITPENLILKSLDDDTSLSFTKLR